MLRLLRHDDRTTRWAARVLGARLLADAALLERRPRVSAAVDAVHAVSMVALAARRPSAARVALPSAAIATAFSYSLVRGQSSDAPQMTRGPMGSPTA